MSLDENIQIDIQQDPLKENQEVKLSDKNIFIKIWTSPRFVFKFLNDNKYDKYVTLLLILSGITSTFDRASTKHMGNNMSLMAVIAMCIIMGGLLGWLTYYIYASMLSWTGKWIKGQGNTKSLLRMLSYAMIPSIMSLLLLIPQIFMFGNGIFQSEMNLYGNGLTSIIVFYLLAFFELVLSLWTIFLVVVGISEVQMISIWKAILNMILPGLILLGIILIIVFVIRLIN